MKSHIPIFAGLFCMASTSWLHAAPLLGTKSVGPTGDYVSLTSAIADIQAQTVGGPLILELQAAYLSSVETFPLTVPMLPGASAFNPVVIRPEAVATALSITSADSTAATVDLHGAQFITFDGRPGGVGMAKELTIANTSTSGVAVRFINEASGNTLRQLSFRGVNTSATSGTIVFSTTTGANGNDNNTIDHCDIRDGATTPAIGLYALGSTATTAQNNSGNIIAHCNVFNFYASSANEAGVRLDGGNTDWTIIANSFYQTASLASLPATISPVFINNTAGNNFTVTGNFIGGSMPNAGGTPWTNYDGGGPYIFQGIRLNVGTTAPSSVQGNTIKNFIWKCSGFQTTLPNVWTGILIEAGSVNIGTVTGNTIGNSIDIGSVSITTSGTVGSSFGISSLSSGTVAIANNTIGSVTTNGTSTSVSNSLTGIQVIAGENTISNNTVGSTTIANSLNAAISSVSTTGQLVTGILSSSSISANITGNTVANLNNNYAGTASAGQIRGIVTSAGLNTIIGNTVRNLSTTSKNSNLAPSLQSVGGIFATSKTAGQTVSQNTVHSLANTAASAAVSMTGIYISAGTSGGHVIARNLLFSLAISSTSASSQLNGIYFGTGAFTAQNNMVRVGVQADGTSTSGASTLRGIFDSGPTPGRNFYHNSVYLGGTQTSSTASTYAFFSSSSSPSLAFQNNIFVNARSNSGATSRHYAIAYTSSVDLAGLTAGGNLFLANGPEGVLGRYNFIDLRTLGEWQAATRQDATSAVADPLFTDATVDLHLQTHNPAEGGGIPLTDALTGAPATVTDDFDGQTRSRFTPADIGADAENFTSSSGDIFAPAISYPLLTSGSTANRVLTGWVTVKDTVSVATGASSPRLYFKKSTDADVFGGNTSADDGWKYVTATGIGPYSFTLDYTLINGGSVTFGDSIQYFVVAQDDANNLGSSPLAATASANPPVQNLNAKPLSSVNSYSIVPTLSGTVDVGSGGTYSSLSGPGGLFAALNAVVLTGNVIVNITSDLTETGGVTLNEFNSQGFPFSTYTVTIQPDSAAMRTISGQAEYGLITLSGADRVMLDGRFGGNGRYLTFRNTRQSTTASTLLLINDASSNTVRNCVVEGAGTSYAGNGVVFFGAGKVTGNDNNLVTDCQVRNPSTDITVPENLIHSSGSSEIVANSGNTISNNELFNFNTSGICMGGGNDLWTLTGNNIYQANDSFTSQTRGISIAGGGNFTITGNFIHDLAPYGNGSIGIYFAGTGTTTLARNRITTLTGDTNNSFLTGILAKGGSGSRLDVVNNQITLSPPDVRGNTTLSLYGLHDGGSTGSVINVISNSIVLGGIERGSLNSWASLRSSTSTHTSRNNLFLNLRIGSTGSHFAAGNEVTGGSYTASHNVYAGIGTTAASFMDFSDTSHAAVPVNFATWQSIIGDTNSQAGIAGSGNFTAALFASAVAGDLHLVPGGNALVNASGTPIPSVTDDYDGDPRPASAPTIGSDQVPFADIAVAQIGALADDGSVNFGPATLGSSGAAKTFTITNPGSADLADLSITKDGTNAGDFTISSLSGTNIAVGSGTVTFSVTFTPGALGARTAAIHISSNVTGAKNPFDIALTGTGLTVNPTFSGYTLKARKNTVASVGISKILSRATDSDGGMLVVSSVTTASSQGGSVTLGASSISYTPPVNFIGLDTFTVTITDGQGGSVLGTVTVNVVEASAVSNNQPVITLQPGGGVAVLFQGVPGLSYQVQRSTDLQAWTLLTTLIAAPDGTLPCLDPSPPVGTAFYRIVRP